MRMNEIYENERVYSKEYNIGEIERMYNDAYPYIKERFGYVPEIEIFELEKVYDYYTDIEYRYDEYGNELSHREITRCDAIGYKLNYFNKIIIVEDCDGGLFVDVMTSEHIKAYDRYSFER